MNQIMQNLIAQAEKMALTTESNSGTADTNTAIGNVRVYRERGVSCINMKSLNLKTSWRLNNKVISQDKLILAFV